MKILLVYPIFPDTYWSFRHALAFEGKQAAFPPLGLLTVSSMLPANWERRLVDMNVEPLAGAQFTVMLLLGVQTSVAVGVSYVTTAVHTPASVPVLKSFGQLIAGGVVSVTWTSNEQVLVLPLPSVAVQLTSVVPIENVLPEAGVQLIEALPQLSVALAL